MSKHWRPPMSAAERKRLHRARAKAGTFIVQFECDEDVQMFLVDVGVVHPHQEQDREQAAQGIQAFLARCMSKGAVQTRMYLEDRTPSFPETATNERRSK